MPAIEKKDKNTSVEPKLSIQELGQYGDPLIKLCTQALQMQPAFGQALAEQFFHRPAKILTHVAQYTAGKNSYDVDYVGTNGQNKIMVHKHLEGVSDERILIQLSFSDELVGHELVDATILYSKIAKDGHGETETHENTKTAIEKTRGFICGLAN